MSKNSLFYTLTLALGEDLSIPSARNSSKVIMSAVGDSLPVVLKPPSSSLVGRPIPTEQYVCVHFNRITVTDKLISLTHIDC